MSFACTNLDEALRDQKPEALAAARAHAETCARCAEALAAWNDIGAAAPLLRRSWDSPALWPRIHQRLAEESQGRPEREKRWRGLRWRVAIAAAALGAVVGTSLLLRSLPPPPVPGPEDPERRLLTERALQEVERSEADYVASVEGLAKVAEPLLENPSSLLLASYREKLQILDAAIADCRAEIDRNRFNAHLRRELLSIYREKQRTLRALMEERT